MSWNSRKRAHAVTHTPSASSWGCELKYLVNLLYLLFLLSASSWGCELKCRQQKPHQSADRCQPLREAVSWNVSRPIYIESDMCQPLREAVSWNTWDIIKKGRCVVSLFVRLWVEIFTTIFTVICVLRQPLREAVSWNILPYNIECFWERQPLREAVSWNINTN